MNTTTTPTPARCEQFFKCPGTYEDGIPCEASSRCSLDAGHAGPHEVPAHEGMFGCGAATYRPAYRTAENTGAGGWESVSDGARPDRVQGQPVHIEVHPGCAVPLAELGKHIADLLAAQKKQRPEHSAVVNSTGHSETVLNPAGWSDLQLKRDRHPTEENPVGVPGESGTPTHPPSSAEMAFERLRVLLIEARGLCALLAAGSGLFAGPIDPNGDSRTDKQASHESVDRAHCDPCGCLAKRCDVTGEALGGLGGDWDIGPGAVDDSCHMASPSVRGASCRYCGRGCGDRHPTEENPGGRDES